MRLQDLYYMPVRFQESEKGKDLAGKMYQFVLQQVEEIQKQAEESKAAIAPF